LEEGGRLSVLILMKGDPIDPMNFSMSCGKITLQRCWYKIFATVYATAINDFLDTNNYVDKNMQKGFWRRVDRLTEHTELLEPLVKSAKREQRSLVVCLLDLKNAFGEVKHKLIETSLNYHHLPAEIVFILRQIYQNNFVVVSMNKKVTIPMKVEHGVLQGDPCSPLLFNIIYASIR